MRVIIFDSDHSIGEPAFSFTDIRLVNDEWRFDILDADGKCVVCAAFADRQKLEQMRLTMIEDMKNARALPVCDSVQLDRIESS